MMFSGKLSLWLLAAALGLAVAGPQTAHAQNAELIGNYKDWDAYTRGTAGNRFCYMVSKPKEASLRSRRGEIFFLVWHRPNQKEFDVVQVDIGYPFKEGSEVEVRVGSNSWTLFTREESAWTVKGTSKRNNATTDSYSLKGTSAASAAIGTACGRS